MLFLGVGGQQKIFKGENGFSHKVTKSYWGWVGVEVKGFPSPKSFAKVFPEVIFAGSDTP